MKTQSIIFASLVGICILGALVFLGISISRPMDTAPIPTSFAQCESDGNPVAETYPRTCRTKSGIMFTEDISAIPTTPHNTASPKLASTSVMVQNITPLPGTKVTSPLVVKGEARGSWYFEASFPVRLEDAGGTVVAQGIAQAQGEWMTENFVPFIATLSWTGTTTGNGLLKLIKDNPSGLPEHAGEIEIPITF